jgi:hypothetical protein
MNSERALALSHKDKLPIGRITPLLNCKRNISELPSVKKEPNNKITPRKREL